MNHGLLFPESILTTPWFAALSAFVALNTIVFLTLAILKILPVVRPGAWFRRPYKRSETRSIHPDAVE
ncbi:hypothetical protein [Actinomyces culturomici]|uniref:hypothetical protein n=1 Tax=Actinomyces culturomici TaxID=1926276 RepID=UPI001C55163F|nr:hypothetical protein [Actinomyces culturomici]